MGSFQGRSRASHALQNTPAPLLVALALGALLAFSAVPVDATSASGEASIEDLKRLSLEDLFDLEVTTVSQKPESLLQVSAAVHVVTPDDLRRTGALSVPEALRNIPGVEVAQVDTRTYAITARGFNGTVANKLLVLIDGRSVYTPLYSGVFWDVQDVLLEDLEQIEVIRGPGATVWGANAVNGVINVLRKPAAETQGLLVSAGAGAFEDAFGGARYGGALGASANYRIYAKGFHRDDTKLPNGNESGDDLSMAQGGFRLDWAMSRSDDLTFQGDGYVGHGEQRGASPLDVGGANAIAHWRRRLSAGAALSFQAFVDFTDRDFGGLLADRLTTYDAEMRHRLPVGSRHELQWGLTFRRTHDVVTNGPTLAFVPAVVDHDLYSAYVQDEWAVFDRRWRLTIGSKFEHNDYTGWEVQPSGRFAWSPRPDRTVWGAVSRASRTPSRIDRDAYAPGTPPYVLAGGPNFDSERLTAYELGYKFQPRSSLLGSLALFYNRYDRLRSIEGSAPPYVLGNGLEGSGRGVEFEANWQPVESARIDAGYTYLFLDLERSPGSTDPSSTQQEGDSPRHQAFVRPSFDVHGVSIDVTARHVARLDNQGVPAYTAIDAHLGWRPRPDVDLGLYARNLNDARHVEFGRGSNQRQIPRNVFGKVTWRF